MAAVLCWIRAGKKTDENWDAQLLSFSHFSSENTAAVKLLFFKLLYLISAQTGKHMLEILKFYTYGSQKGTLFSHYSWPSTALDSRHLYSPTAALQNSRIKKQKHSLRILTRRGLFSSCLLFMYHQTSCSFSWEFWSLVLTILWSLICLMGVQCIRTRIIYHLTCLGVWWTKWFTVLCSGNFSIACNIPLLCLVQRPGAGLNLSRCIDRFDVSLTCAASPLNSTSPCALKTNFSFLPSFLPTPDLIDRIFRCQCIFTLFSKWPTLWSFPLWEQLFSFCSRENR